MFSKESIDVSYCAYCSYCRYTLIRAHGNIEAIIELQTKGTFASRIQNYYGTEYAENNDTWHVLQEVGEIAL